MKPFWSLVVFIGLFFLVSCKDLNNVCSEEKYSSAIVYDFPDSLKAGTEHELKVEYILENSCGSFLEFEEKQISDTTEVKIKLKYEGCSCNLQFEQKVGYYSLQQDSAGIYKYRFWVGDGEYDSFFLKVYE